MIEERQEILLSGLLENNKDKIYEITDNMYPIDIAIILEKFDNKNILKFYELMDSDLFSINWTL